MKRRLFLTGPMGCGKSTAIARALGEKITKCGGFLTRRYREPYLHFSLESPDGTYKRTFLGFENGEPDVDLSVFSDISFTGKVLILDEIGGIELLNPDFYAGLDGALNRDIPILGVIKGEEAAGALIESLGLSEEYTVAASRLRQSLQSDPDTMVYQCGQFDNAAFCLARKWVEEYLHDGN